MGAFSNPGAKPGRVADIGGNTANVTPPNRVNQTTGNVAGPSRTKKEIPGCGNYFPGQIANGKTTGS